MTARSPIGGTTGKRSAPEGNDLVKKIKTLSTEDKNVFCKGKITTATLTSLANLPNTYLILSYATNKRILTYPITYLCLSHFLTDMDTSTRAKKSIRASLTAQYEARVADTLERVDPNRAKARAALQDQDMEVEALDGEWNGYKEPLPTEPDS